MQARSPVKKSVTVDPEVLEELGKDRLANLSATVNESLRLLSMLDRQRRLVATWERERGATYSDAELAPYVELILKAEARHASRRSRQRTAADHAPGP